LPAAGGGVLMHDAYASVEAVLALRGMPDNVSAAIGRCRNLPQQPPRETEDVATAILRYEDGGIVAIRVGWDIAPFEQVTQHHTDIQTLTLAPLHGQLLDRSGVVLNQVDLPHEIDEHDLLQFLRLLRSERPSEIARERLMRHLQIAAVIEAIYLSARTWQPETPHKLLEVHGWPTRI
jgi:predicted dehydrogenase